MKPLSMAIVIGVLFVSGCAYPQRYQDPQTSERLFRRGILHLEKGELVQAEAAFRVALEAEERADVLDGLGCVLMERGEFGKAEQFFQLSISLDPSYASAHGNLALLYEERGDVRKAEELYEKALSLDPGNYRIRNNFAVLLFDNGRAEDEVTELLLEAAAVAGRNETIDANLYMHEEITK